jgi:hypothetical protein
MILLIIIYFKIQQFLNTIHIIAYSFETKQAVISSLPSRLTPSIFYPSRTPGGNCEDRLTFLPSILTVKVQSLSSIRHSFESRAATVYEHEIYVVSMETPDVKTT